MHLHLKAVTVPVKPMAGDITELEKIFTATRSLHNVICSSLSPGDTPEEARAVRVTNAVFRMLQDYDPAYLAFRKEACKDKPFGQEDIEAIVDGMSLRYDRFDWIEQIPKYVRESHTHILASIWSDYAFGQRKRPTIKSGRGRQSFWLLNPAAYTVDRNEIRLKFSTRQFFVLKMEGEGLQGTPTVMKVIRRFTGEYLVWALYEQPSENPAVLKNRFLMEQIRKLERYVSRAGRQPSASRNLFGKTNYMTNTQATLSLLRMRILGIMIGRQSRAMMREQSITTQEQDDEHEHDE